MAAADSRKVLGFLAAAGLSLGAIFGGSLLVAPHEGVVNSAYYDPVGILTSCYGHTGRDIRVGAKYTDEECAAQLTGDVKKVDEQVRSVITVPLTWYQEAALISFTYNVGVGNLRNSTLARLFNEKRYAEGCGQMLRWVYAGGKKLRGLEKRRQQETEVCLGNVKSVGDQ